MAKNGKPTRRTSPVITPLKGIGLPEIRLKPELLSDSDIAHLRRKSAWTLEETAWALCGYRVPEFRVTSIDDLPQEVRQAVECMSAARITKDLTPIGAPDLNGLRKYLARDEIIKWADGGFPKFPFANTSGSAHIPPPSPRAIPVAEQNDEAVLAALRAAGHDPLALPPRRNGQPTAKAAARKRCSLTPAQFDHAWKALRAAGRIKERD